MAVATSGKPAGRLAAAFRVVSFFGRGARSHFANILTLARLVAVGPLLWAMSLGRYDLALQIFIAAALSDALDGWYAKATDTRSALGALLDPIADKVIVTASLLALAAVGTLPYWFVVLVLAREVWIGLGYLALRIRARAWAAVVPSVLGKLATALELILIGVALTHLALGIGLEAIIFAMSALTATALVLASVQYAQQFLAAWRRPAIKLPVVVMPS